MRNNLKISKYLRWVVAGAFSFMLVLNIMVSFSLENDELLPRLSFVEMGNNAYAIAQSQIELTCNSTSIALYKAEYVDCGTCSKVENRLGTLDERKCNSSPIIY